MKCRHCGGECQTHSKGIVEYHVETACPAIQAKCRELLRLRAEDKRKWSFSPAKWLRELLCG